MAKSPPDLLVLTAELVAAYVGHSRVSPEELPAIIRSIRDTLSEDTSSPAPVEAPTPNKPSKAEIRKSITPDALISFVDGRPYKTLKRHLTTNGMTMAQYRERYGLPSDYPSVAPAYSASRSAMAKALGLGGKGRGSQPVAAPQPEPEPAPAPDPAPPPKPARAARKKKPTAAADTPADAAES